MAGSAFGDVVTSGILTLVRLNLTNEVGVLSTFGQELTRFNEHRWYFLTETLLQMCIIIYNVLRPFAIPFINRHFPSEGGILQHDGARTHTANVTRNSIAQNGLNVLHWPALSLDMSPIEHTNYEI